MLSKSDAEKIQSAINSGVDKDAVRSILEDMMNNVDRSDSTPNQVSQVIEFIAKMKSDKEDVTSEAYLSNLVKKNSVKIKSALNDGISPDEVATTLVDSINLDSKSFGFLTKLISIMKGREDRLKMQRGSYQKVIKYEN